MKGQSTKHSLVAQSINSHHRARVLAAGQLRLSRQTQKSRLRIYPRHLTYVAAAAAAVLALMLLTPRFESLDPSMTPSMVATLQMDPAAIEDLELLMDLEDLETWEEVEEWPES